MMKLINIGYGNMISAARIITIVSPDSAPIKRLIQEAKDDGRAIDATYGRKTRAVIVMDSGHIVMQGPPKDIFSQVDTLKGYHLDVPQVTLLAEELRRSGVPLTPGILSVEELVEEICQL